MNKLHLKQSIIALLVAAPLAMTLPGCVIKINDDGIDHGLAGDSEDRSHKNRKKIAQLQLGASFIDIQENLGVADFSETYAESGNTIRVLYYRTQRRHKDGLTTKDECTFVQFINDELVETGNGGDYRKTEKVKSN